MFSPALLLLESEADFSFGHVCIRNTTFAMVCVYVPSPWVWPNGWCKVAHAALEIKTGHPDSDLRSYLLRDLLFVCLNESYLNGVLAKSHEY